MARSQKRQACERQFHEPLGVSGQASVELIAAVPVIVVASLVAVQLVVAGWAVWSAENAARAGARAAHIGRDGGLAARRALPERLRRGAQVTGKDEVRVRVRVPRITAAAPAITVGSGAALEDADG